MNLNSDFFVYETFDNFITVSEVFRKALDLPLISRLWGFWSPRLGFVFNESFKWSRRKDLSGVVLRCATLEYSPNVFVKAINQTKYQQIDGIFGDVWKEIQRHLNFSYWTVLAPDGIWSHKYSNGTWVGLFGMLQNNQVDVLLLVHQEL